MANLSSASTSRSTSPFHSQSRVADAIQVAPYLTHVVRHHGQITLIPPVNAGRTRKAKKTQRAGKGRGFATDGLTTGTTPSHRSRSSSPSSFCNISENTHPAAPSTTVLVGNDNLAVPDFPPPSFEEAMSSSSVASGSASTTPQHLSPLPLFGQPEQRLIAQCDILSPRPHDAAHSDTDSVAEEFPINSELEELNATSTSALSRRLLWEEDRKLGLSLEERVRREFERRQKTEVLSTVVKPEVVPIDSRLMDLSNMTLRNSLPLDDDITQPQDESIVRSPAAVRAYVTLDQCLIISQLEQERELVSSQSGHIIASSTDSLPKERSILLLPPSAERAANAKLVPDTRPCFDESLSGCRDLSSVSRSPDLTQLSSAAPLFSPASDSHTVMPDITQEPSFHDEPIEIGPSAHKDKGKGKEKKLLLSPTIQECRDIVDSERQRGPGRFVPSSFGTRGSQADSGFFDSRFSPPPNIPTPLSLFAGTSEDNLHNNVEKLNSPDFEGQIEENQSREADCRRPSKYPTIVQPRLPRIIEALNAPIISPLNSTHRRSPPSEPPIRVDAPEPDMLDPPSVSSQVVHLASSSSHIFPPATSHVLPETPSTTSFVSYVLASPDQSSDHTDTPVLPLAPHRNQGASCYPSSPRSLPTLGAALHISPSSILDSSTYQPFQVSDEGATFSLGQPSSDFSVDEARQHMKAVATPPALDDRSSSFGTTKARPSPPLPAPTQIRRRPPPVPPRKPRIRSNSSGALTDPITHSSHTAASSHTATSSASRSEGGQRRKPPPPPTRSRRIYVPATRDPESIVPESNAVDTRSVGTGCLAAVSIAVSKPVCNDASTSVMPVTSAGHLDSPIAADESGRMPRPMSPSPFTASSASSRHVFLSPEPENDEGGHCIDAHTLSLATPAVGTTSSEPPSSFSTSYSISNNSDETRPQSLASSNYRPLIDLQLYSVPLPTLNPTAPISPTHRTTNLPLQIDIGVHNSNVVPLSGDVTLGNFQNSPLGLNRREEDSLHIGDLDHRLYIGSSATPDTSLVRSQISLSLPPEDSGAGSTLTGSNWINQVGTETASSVPDLSVARLDESNSDDFPSPTLPLPLDPLQPVFTGYTDLDVLLARLEQNTDAANGLSYDDFLAISDLIGPANDVAHTSNHSAMEDIPTGRVEVERRRVMKDGRVKLKLSLLGIMVDKCGICLSQFKKEEWACLLPCQHTFHEHCLRHWVLRSRTCPICRNSLGG